MGRKRTATTDIRVKSNTTMSTPVGFLSGSNNYSATFLTHLSSFVWLQRSSVFVRSNQGGVPITNVRSIRERFPWRSLTETVNLPLGSSVSDLDSANSHT